MLGRLAVDRVEPLWLKRFVLGVIRGLLIASIVVAVLDAGADRMTRLSIVLAIAAIAAGIMVAGTRGAPSVSASFIVFVLAAAFLGPASACAAAILAELAAAARARTPLRVVALINLPASVIPAVAVAGIMRALVSPPADSAAVYADLAMGASLAYVLSFVIFAASRRVLRPEASIGVGHFIESLPGAAINVLLVLAGASIYLRLGLRGIAFAITAVFAFSYMAHLL